MMIYLGTLAVLPWQLTTAAASGTAAEAEEEAVLALPSLSTENKFEYFVRRIPRRFFFSLPLRPFSEFA